jgi:hypothetical protein
MNDIYYRVGKSLYELDYCHVDIEEKKRLVDDELKKYIISKLQELDSIVLIEDKEKQELTVIELLQILANKIPKENHFNTIRHYTHFILKIASELQKWELSWSGPCGVDEYPPIAEGNEFGKWNNLDTHEKTDLVTVFAFTYDIFQNHFMIKNREKGKFRIAGKLDTE